MTRLLGVDLGERRIGLAIADRDGRSAFALMTLNRARDTASDAAAIARVAADQAVEELVVGLPLHANGDEGSQAALTREWVAAVAPILDLPVTFRDERLTSHLAESRVGPMKRGRSGGPPTRVQRDAYRARIDREAAAIILQDELDARAAAADGTAGTTDLATNTTWRAPGPTRTDNDTETPQMTIRSGGRPRDTRQAHPLDTGTYDDAWEPDYRTDGSGSGNGYGNGRGNGYGNGRSRRGSGGGHHGILRFLAFALVLAAIVLVSLVTVLRPVVQGAVVDWASDNPGALGISFVADMVRADLGPKLTDPASTDTEQVNFTIGSGETATTIAQRLETQGFLADRRAFVLLAVERDLASQLRSGTFILRKSMTPDQLVTALLKPGTTPYIDIALRTGLRLEQITAKLETIPGLEMNPADFLELARHPTKELLADYPWLDLPDGASLEGYLWPATYRVLPDTTPEELVRLMLDKFKVAIGDRMNVPESRGMTWRQVLTLASLVEREATLDSEKPLIAGVFQNRLDPKLFPNGHLGSDVTVFYVNDTLQLANLPVEQWKEYVFWTTLKDNLPADLPTDLAGYNTYTSTGLMPGPIATPTLASIDAALNPDTKDHYLYFLAKKDGSGGTVFAKTHAEHEQNIAKYGQ